MAKKKTRKAGNRLAKKAAKKKKAGGKEARGGYWVLGFLLFFLGLFVLNIPSQEGMTGAAGLEITPAYNTAMGIFLILGGLFLIGVVLYMSRVKDKGIVEE